MIKVKSGLIGKRGKWFIIVVCKHKRTNARSKKEKKNAWSTYKIRKVYVHIGNRTFCY